MNIATADFGVAKVVFLVENKIQDMDVTIVSESLTEEVLQEFGLDDQFSLTEPGEYEEAIKGSLGLPCGEEVVDKTELTFDITTFVPMLAAFSGDHTFKIDITDQKGNTKSYELKFHVN